MSSPVIDSHAYQQNLTREVSERALAELEKMGAGQTMPREAFATMISPNDWHTAIKVIDDLAYLERLVITDDYESIEKVQLQ